MSNLASQEVETSVLTFNTAIAVNRQSLSVVTCFGEAHTPVMKDWDSQVRLEKDLKNLKVTETQHEDRQGSTRALNIFLELLMFSWQMQSLEVSCAR